MSETQRRDLFIQAILRLCDMQWLRIDNQTSLRPKFWVQFLCLSEWNWGLYETGQTMPSDHVHAYRRLKCPTRRNDSHCWSSFLSGSCPPVNTFPGLAIPACCIRRVPTARRNTHQQSQHDSKTPFRRTSCSLQKAHLPFRWYFSNSVVQRCTGISDSLPQLLELRIPVVQLYELKAPPLHCFPSPSSPKCHR